MSRQIFDSIHNIFTALFHHHRGLGRYLVYAVLISILLFIVLMWGGWALFSNLGNVLAQLLPGHWKYEGMFYQSLGFIISSLLVLSIFKYLVLILLGGILSTIATKAETFNDSDENRISFAHSVLRSIKINVNYLLYEWIITIGFMLLLLVPFISFFAVTAIYMVQAFYAGAGISDFYLEKKLTFTETREITRKHKWACMTIGAFFLIVFVIPFFGILVAPYLCTIASTKYFEKQLHPIS
jgi:CysZ protein